MRRGRVGAVAVAAAALVALPGCELKDDGSNLVNGKTQFVAKCGSCHTLARANATGVVGPNLDEAWQQADKDGLGRSTYEGVVHRQILQPARSAQTDPATGRPGAAMPANLVTGEDAEDVAAYVAQAAAKRGEDPGRLATVGPERSEEVARAEGGTLSIPADPSGATLYTAGAAVAPPGALTIESENPSGVPHNIAVEGNGVNVEGPVVQNGGVSRVEVDLDAGEYTFYCSVPGHREGGMEGPLRVK
jgi:mono/diheme cytochrome c family protein